MSVTTIAAPAEQGKDTGGARPPRPETPRTEPTGGYGFPETYRQPVAGHRHRPAGLGSKGVGSATLNREVNARLASCRWIENTTNLVILGKSGVGKSYLTHAPGQRRLPARLHRTHATSGSMTCRTS